MQSCSAQPLEKRRTLKSYDLMPSQILNPMGESGVVRTALKDIYESMAKGNKAAQFFSELCDQDPGRKGIAISRLCEVWLKIGKTLFAEKGPYAKHLKDETYKKAHDDFKKIEGSLNECMGKGIAMEEKAMTVGQIAYAAGQ